MNVAIIPARGGSTRIPRKNIRLFHGRPIMYYSIMAARECELFDQVIVSTEDPEIGEMAYDIGAHWYKRPLALADNDVGTQEVTRHVLSRLQHKPDIACCIYATAPLMDPAHLLMAYDLMRGNKRAYCYAIHGWRDAGQFYMGQAQAFLEGVPLEHWSTTHVEVGTNRYCDINTEEDWKCAEIMYASLQRKA